MTFPLTIHIGNSPRQLTKVLAGELEKMSAFDPMRPLWVATGQRGMDRAVKAQLTEHWGVNANIRMLKPMMMLTNLANAVVQGPDLLSLSQEEIGASLDAILWPIFAELKAKKIHDPTIEDVYAPLRAWFARAAGEQDPSSGRTLMQLAMQLRRVYIAYQADRPQWHEWWVHGHSSSPFANAEFRVEGDLPVDLRWQVPLWKRVREIGDPFIPSAVDLARNLRGASAQEKARVREEVQGVHIFGVTKLSELQRELIDALREVVPMWLYVASPTTEYWSDVRREDARQENISPLLPRFAHHSRFLHDQITELSSRGETLEYSHFTPPEPTTLLKYIQHQAVSPWGVDGAEKPNDDDSIGFHRSHGPLRQVEVLHDLILEQIEKIPGLEPCDIAVLCPRLSEFAPFIEAVFRTNHPSIPYRIEDQSVEVANPVADALLRVASLSDKRVSPRDIVELLNAPVVRAKFGIGADEVPTLTQWLAQLEVRWGWNTNSRAAAGRPGETLSTWEAAIRRLALGVVFDANDFDISSGLVPPFDDDHAGNLDLARRLVHLLRELFDIIQTFQSTKTIKEWTQFLIGTPGEDAEASDLLSRLVQLPHGSAFLRDEIYRELALMQKESELSGLNDESLDGQALSAWLQETFAEAQSRRDKRGNAVSFAELKADRFVENRVTFLLGMDDGVFPRPSLLPSWDLRQFSPRPNDTSPRDEDLFAMLQALLLTQDHFGIIWKGTDPTSNQTLPPALPILELQRIIAGECRDGELAIRRMTVDHRLHPFSIQAFLPSDEAQRAPFTYKTQWAKAAAETLNGDKKDISPLVEEGTQLDVIPTPTVDVATLSRALYEPLKTFLREGAGINPDEKTTKLRDDDIDLDDSLERYQVNQTRLQVFTEEFIARGSLDGAMSEEQILVLRAKGAIRPGELGIHEAQEHAHKLSRLLVSAPHPTRAPRSFSSVTIGRTTVFARRSFETQDSLFTVAASSHLFQAVLEPWAHICVEAAASQKPTSCVIVAPVLKNFAGIYTLTVDPPGAEDWLDFAVNLRNQIVREPLPNPSAWKQLLEGKITDMEELSFVVDCLFGAPEKPPFTASEYKNAGSSKYGERRLEERIFGEGALWHCPLVAAPRGSSDDDESSTLLDSAGETWMRFTELYRPILSNLAELRGGTL